jgi:hypothetical protein
LVRATSNLDWLILTKRPQNIGKMLPPDWGDGYPNVWLGISAGNQHYYVQRWPLLASIPAVKRFVSYEPALAPLGSIDIGVGVLPDWILVGGESGKNPREMDLQWALDARHECARLGVAYFFKQTTGKRAIPPDLFVRQFPRMGPLAPTVKHRTSNILRAGRWKKLHCRRVRLDGGRGCARLVMTADLTISDRVKLFAEAVNVTLISKNAQPAVLARNDGLQNSIWRGARGD